MAAKMQDIEHLPNPWMSFYLRNKPAAYDVDQTAGTTPVWQQLANLDQAKSNYGAIVYNKAPGILKQLNYLVGDSAFRAGVHAFLVKHAYGNATWQDLLAAIGTASGRSLIEWGRQYILRPGMPIVEQRLEIQNGVVKRLMLIQHPAQSCPAVVCGRCGRKSRCGRMARWRGRYRSRSRRKRRSSRRLPDNPLPTSSSRITTTTRTAS
jgi:aminopeptidase N